MDKLSYSKIAEVLQDAKDALLAVTDERDKLAEENAGMKRRIEAEKLASVMHSKGIRMDVDPETLAGELEKEADGGRFEVIREAVDMVGPNMGLAASINEDVPGGGATAFEQYIFGNVG